MLVISSATYVDADRKITLPRYPPLLRGHIRQSGHLCLRATEIRKKDKPLDIQILSSGCINFFSLRLSQGKHDEAGQLSQRSLIIREKVLGPYHPDVAHSLNNWASSLVDQVRAVHMKQKRCCPI